jgi:8-oxo-dGTP pyrophosphatase MutT (NUDIX family)
MVHRKRTDISDHVVNIINHQLRGRTKTRLLITEMRIDVIGGILSTVIRGLNRYFKLDFIIHFNSIDCCIYYDHDKPVWTHFLNNEYWNIASSMTHIFEKFLSGIIRSLDDYVAVHVVKQAIKAPLFISKTSFEESWITKSLTIEASFRAAGVIPYCYHNGTLWFLLQRVINTTETRYCGWSDFGGKKDPGETICQTAAREFCEETSCLIYLNEMVDNPEFKSIMNTKDILQQAQSWFQARINQHPIRAVTHNYVCYFVLVKYFDACLLPERQDTHENAYLCLRECKWFTFRDILRMNPEDYHGRIRQMQIKDAIKHFNKKDGFMIPPESQKTVGNLKLITS